ncbi:MAG TPA: prefoldin subunit beta [Methanomassiliicoccaceae archaeon]|nr:prefoldin subunit beta [Methanomassiliicoccaceae archaeon]HOL07277.1 prefoldin subunit beta [Methanomassiliicoccaceae archaeon]HOQ26748.1 prefoldin subunit beta [Methanomassiliicoccaceae archaeon]HPP44393.1 prefoldin subunit beta [Methanomassiliicoccaceae archaeon]HPT74791.1 prefoldin subunit beta [Methanomassiliicoccaceae archaeon]
MNELSPKVQNQIAQFQQLQQQLQALVSQKYQMDIRLKEMQRTIEELNKAPADVTVYKSVGSLLIKAKSKDELLKEMEEGKETMDIRVKALDRQEKGLRERYQQLQEQISKAFGPAMQGGQAF